jgi:hypothetical protein
VAEPKRGRPSVAPGQTTARVHVSLAPADYDRAHSIARRDGVSVPEVVRRGLSKVLSEESEDD